MDKVPITKEGYDRLRKEFERMRNVVLPENAAEIEVARAHGDLSENAEYKAAKEKQAFIISKIKELENNIMSCDVIELKHKNADKAVFGVFVEVEDQRDAGSVIYQLVGPFESDINENRISVTSPLGRALIGKMAGDEVSFQTPGGLRKFDIVNISDKGNE